MAEIPAYLSIARRTFKGRGRRAQEGKPLPHQFAAHQSISPIFGKPQVNGAAGEPLVTLFVA